jgi:hypothetical protein
MSKCEGVSADMKHWKDFSSTAVFCGLRLSFREAYRSLLFVVTGGGGGGGGGGDDDGGDDDDDDDESMSMRHYRLPPLLN